MRPPGHPARASRSVLHTLPCFSRHSPLPQFIHKRRPTCQTTTDDPLVGSIAQQYLADRAAHDKTAAEWTKRYASG